MIFNVLNADTKDFQKIVNDILLEVKPMRLRGSISDKFLGYCNELRKQIVDLEAKHSESENLNKRLQQVIDKLRDKEFAGETLVNAVNAVYEPVYQNKCDEVEQLKQQLADALKDFNDIQEENDKLEQQLQEEKNRSKKLNHEAQKYYEDAYCNGIQNQTAIAELEKAKEFIREFVGINNVKFICTTTITEQLDQQIAELKGEK